MNTNVIPFISYADIRTQADTLRQRLTTPKAIPVDPEIVIESVLGLHIRTIRGLREEEIDAYLTSDFSSVVVDWEDYMEGRFPNRFRFSLAHEAGHVILHSGYHNRAAYDSSDGWVRYTQELAEDDWLRLEWQANEFAGRLLVPPEVLNSEFRSAVDPIVQEGRNLAQLTEQELDHVCGIISGRFAVSAAVIRIRLSREGIFVV